MLLNRINEKKRNQLIGLIDKDEGDDDADEDDDIDVDVNTKMRLWY